MNKAWEHFKTITHHKLLVMDGCFRVGLFKQGLLHDLSKYTPTEFLVGAKYYQGDRSPNNAEREDIGYSSAWLHHKGISIIMSIGLITAQKILRVGWLPRLCRHAM